MSMGLIDQEQWTKHYHSNNLPGKPWAPGVVWAWLDSVRDEPRHVSRLLAYTHSPILIIDASMGEGK